MIRDFEYKGVKYHLNDNGHPKSARREFEGRYILLWWNTAYERWQMICYVNTKKEAQKFVREFFERS